MIPSRYKTRLFIPSVCAAFPLAIVSDGLDDVICSPVSRQDACRGGTDVLGVQDYCNDGYEGVGGFSVFCFTDDVAALAGLSFSEKLIVAVVLYCHTSLVEQFVSFWLCILLAAGRGEKEDTSPHCQVYLASGK